MTTLVHIDLTLTYDEAQALERLIDSTPALTQLDKDVVNQTLDAIDAALNGIPV